MGIAIYQLQFQSGDDNDVVIGPNDDIMLQICLNNNGTPRVRKCKWVQRDMNNGEEMMQKSDNEEERRQQIKNSLEENTFQFKDELSSSDERIKEQKAWNECMKFVSDLEDQIMNDEKYENLSTDTYIRQLDAINEKYGSYRKWNDDYLKYLQNKKVQQQINNENNDNCNDPFSPLFSQSFPSHRQYIMPEYSQNTWGRN